MAAWNGPCSSCAVEEIGAPWLLTLVTTWNPGDGCDPGRGQYKVSPFPGLPLVVWPYCGGLLWPLVPW